MLLPAALEYKFRSKNIYFGKVPLTGAIDRIDLLPDNTLRILDYKTGTPKSQNELLGEGKNSDGGYYRQLLFYRLALSLDNTWSKYPVEYIQVEYVEGKHGEYKTITLPIDFEKQ